MAFGGQPVGLHLWKAAKAAQASTCRDNAMVGQARFIGPPHDLTDGTSGAGTSRHACDVAVRHDLT